MPATLGKCLDDAVEGIILTLSFERVSLHALCEGTGSMTLVLRRHGRGPGSAKLATPSRSPSAVFTPEPDRQP